MTRARKKAPLERTKLSGAIGRLEVIEGTMTYGPSAGQPARIVRSFYRHWRMCLCGHDWDVVKDGDKCPKCGRP